MKARWAWLVISFFILTELAGCGGHVPPPPPPPVITTAVVTFKWAAPHIVPGLGVCPSAGYMCLDRYIITNDKGQNILTVGLSSSGLQDFADGFMVVSPTPIDVAAWYNLTLVAKSTDGKEWSSPQAMTTIRNNKKAKR